jgi:putative tricarboxylic transport membrane protein
MPSVHVRNLVYLGIATVLGGASACVSAQAWTPQKNIELVVSTSPGGSNDKTARLLERIIVRNKLVDSTLSIVNKVGAGGSVAGAYINQRPGDAHHLFIATPNLISMHILGQSASSHHDFTPVASLLNDYVLLAVNVNSPIKTGKDLVEKLKASSQSVTIGFASALGNHHHITTGLVTKAVGGDVRGLKLVVFKGSAEAITALLGGHIDVVSTSPANAHAHVSSGRMRVLGVASPLRLSGALGSTPTWREQGVDVVYGSWRAVMGPRKLTPAQVTYWENVLRKVTENPEWKADLETNFWSSYFETGAQFRKDLDREYAETKSVMTEIGLIK